MPNDNESISASNAETVSQRIALGGGRDRVPRAAADDVARAATVTPYEAVAPVITTVSNANVFNINLQSYAIFLRDD